MPLRVILFVLLVFLEFSPLHAQDEDSALLEMLSFVPDVPEVRTGLMNYANFSSMLPLLAETTPIDDVDSLLACLRDEDCEYIQDWMFTWPSLGTEIIQPRELLMGRVLNREDCERDPETFQLLCGEPPVFDAMVDAMGFGPFDMTGSLTMSSRDLPPVMMVAGDFDLEAIDTAFIGRGYATQLDTPEGVTLWCVAEGCDVGISGMETMDTANIFGGRVGAKRPAAFAAGHLVSGVSIEHVEQFVDAYTGEQRSLADASDMQAAVEALESIPGTLIQALLIGSPSTLSMDLDTILAGRIAAGDEISEEVVQEIRETYGLDGSNPMPAYEMAAIADYRDEIGRQTVVALVFDDADSAASAAVTISERMENYISLEWVQPLSKLLEGRVDEFATQLVTSESKTVLLLQWWMVPPDAGDEQRESTYRQGGLFTLMYRFVISQDMGWLAMQ